MRLRKIDVQRVLEFPHKEVKQKHFTYSNLSVRSYHPSETGPLIVGVTAQKEAV